MPGRLQQHLTGKGGAKYTRRFKPVALAMVWQLVLSKGDAMRIEYQIKQLTKLEKERLVESPGLLFQLIAFDLPEDAANQAYTPSMLKDIWHDVVAATL